MGRAIGGGRFHTENEAWGRDAENSPLFADSKRYELFGCIIDITQYNSSI